MEEVIGKCIIQQGIITKIKEAKIHTILCDEVTSCNYAIKSMCDQFVDAKKLIREELLEFIEVERITGEVLFEAVVQFYKRNDIHIENLHSRVTMCIKYVSSKKVNQGRLTLEQRRATIVAVRERLRIAEGHYSGQAGWHNINA